ncbi:MAG: exonuclease domain-containing protein [Promethearchaeota archaeon]
MTYFSIDIESDGPIPGDYSMVWLGAVVVRPGLHDYFEGKLKPISEKYLPEVLRISHLTRKETLSFDDPKAVMEKFQNWIIQVKGSKRAIFISDNNGFDWQYVNWYFHHFLGENPFGHSSQNLGSLYKGLVGDMYKNFKHLRKTEHTHNPLDDARGNAEALLYLKEKLGLKINFD